MGFGSGFDGDSLAPDLSGRLDEGSTGDFLIPIDPRIEAWTISPDTGIPNSLPPSLRDLTVPIIPLTDLDPFVLTVPGAQFDGLSIAVPDFGAGGRKARFDVPPDLAPQLDQPATPFEVAPLLKRTTFTREDLANPLLTPAARTLASMGVHARERGIDGVDTTDLAAYYFERGGAVRSTSDLLDTYDTVLSYQRIQGIDPARVTTLSADEMRRFDTPEQRRELAKRFSLPIENPGDLILYPIGIDGQPTVGLRDLGDNIANTKSVGQDTEETGVYRGPPPDGNTILNPPTGSITSDVENCGWPGERPCFHSTASLGSTDESKCSGAVIAPDAILSAAHCFCGGKNSRVNLGRVHESLFRNETEDGPILRSWADGTVLFYGHTEPGDGGFCERFADLEARKKTASPTELRALAQSVYEMPDLAVLLLDKELTRKNVPFLSLSLVSPELVSMIDTIYVSGFGRSNTYSGGGVKTNFITVLDPAECGTIVPGTPKRYGHGDVCFPETELAFISRAALADFCKGDSGMPVTVKLKGGGMGLIAIGSRGVGPKECGTGGIAVSIANVDVRTWLRTVLGESLKEVTDIAQIDPIELPGRDRIAQLIVRPNGEIQ